MSDLPPETPMGGDNGDEAAAVSAAGNPIPGIRRDTPQPEQGRQALLNEIQDDVRRSRAKWRPVFDRMKDDMDFTMGLQWPGSTLWSLRTDEQEYVVNICLRHVQQLTATLYAKNPTMVAKTRPKLLNTVWD